MRDRRWAGERGGRRHLAREALQDPASHAARQQHHAAYRRARRASRSRRRRRDSRAAGPVRRGGLRTSDVPITGIRLASARSSASATCQPREAAVSSSEYAPGAAQNVRAGGADERCGAAVEHGLGRGHGHHEIGVDEHAGCTRSSVRPASPTDDELVRLGVVHLDPAAERTRGRRREQGLELAAPGPSLEPAGDEQRLPLRGDPQALELADRRPRAPPAGDRPAHPAAAAPAARRRASPCRPASRAPRAAGPTAGSAASPARPRRRRRSPPAAAAAGAGARRPAP